MKKILTRVFLALIMVVLCIFVVAFGASAYEYYRALHIDDPIDPYVQVTVGDVTVTRGNFAVDMVTGDRYSLLEGDVVMTRNASDATIFWPDRSTTELGPNSKLVIHRMRVAADYSHIELEASLEQGKIWTNMVRTLYPGSYMRVRLPSPSLVAGVRGTVFEINLEHGYVHSVDHVVTLKNQFFQEVVLLPGNIVSVWDMFRELGEEVLDQAWIQANLLKDQAYNLLRSSELDAAWDRISGKWAEGNMWDVFVRNVLSRLEMFQEIRWAEALRNFDARALVDVPKEWVLEWYQHLK